MDTPYLKSNRRLIQLRPSTPETPSRGLNLSIPLEPFELQHMLGGNGTSLFNQGNNTLNATTLDDISVTSRSVLTAQDLDSEQQQSLMFKEKMDMLFPQFLEVLQARSNESDIFDTIQDLIQTCMGVLDSIQHEIERSGTTNIIKVSQAAMLDKELKTWKLLYALYKDRIRVQNGNKSSACMEFDLPLGASEKEVVEHLYATNATLREHQLIVDWLEATYEKRDTGPDIGHSTDRQIGWENTLLQLQSRREIAFGHGADIVKSLDPDATVREKRPLHALDEEDNMRLLRCVFREIRQGRIDEAMSLCKYCGQTWRAVILEGWRLYEDPNYDIQMTVNEKLPIDGNPRRDIWKKCAWMMADSKKYDETWRAIIGSFCGHLESQKALLGNSWEDLLWAYLKVQIDIRVEGEIRTCCMKNYYNMPAAYWNSKMTLTQIFDELAVHNDAAVREYAESKIGLIQKYLIMDNVSELLQELHRWVQSSRRQSLDRTGGGDSGNVTTEPISPHLLRFFSHIVLFMRQIGRLDSEDIADEIIEAYVETLIKLGDAQLVAFYTAALPNKMQISLYSKFLEGITASSARLQALKEAKNARLDVENITRYTVETIAKRMPKDSELSNESHKLRAGEISTLDEQKIHALEWLTILPTQRGELLWQANSMIRKFLAEGKAECVRAVHKMVPGDSITQIVNTYGSDANLPCREECSIKEYISFKVHLVAMDNFNDWTQLYHNKPKKPVSTGGDVNFTERIAWEHKEQQYRAELNRWTENVKEHCNLARDALFNVLVFPEQGWLVDPVTTKEPVNIEPLVWENRRLQMEKLRSICIPEIVLLLHQVLYQSKDYQGCVKLSETLADETQKLYKVYNEHKLAEILLKIADSSLKLLHDKKDPWGYTPM